MRSGLHWIPLALVACASAPPKPERPGSRGPHANEHLTAAEQHDELARERAMWPDTRAPDGTGRVDQLLIGSPWHRRWDTVEDHRRLAAIHRSEAARIQAAYHEACGERPLALVSVSPLVRHATGGRSTEIGVELYLPASAGTGDQLLADMKCHRAWMMLAPASMELCPLDLEGLLVEVHGAKEGITVTLSVRDKTLVPELQRRAAHDLEHGAKLRSKTH